MSDKGYSFQTGHKNTFSVWDYVIFGGMLSVSTFIGFFYAIKDRKITNTKLFLLAGGNMNFMPVSMSLLASFMSAITLLGTPAEMYNYGTMYWWIGISYFFSVGMAAHIYVPIFYNLKVTSCYEIQEIYRPFLLMPLYLVFYITVVRCTLAAISFSRSILKYLEKRFSPGVRMMGTVLFSFQMIIYMSIVLYGPSLALNAVTGFSLWGAIISVGVLCTVYTSMVSCGDPGTIIICVNTGWRLCMMGWITNTDKFASLQGGMKAVLWTDAFQTVMMITGLLATLIQGCIEMGGFSNAWEIAARNKRVYFTDFNPDPTVRHSFWTLVVGSAFLWGSVYGTNQAQVQRTLACGSLRNAQLALWLNFPGLCIILMLSCLVGIVMYAFYSTCDPIKFGLVMASDQLYPLFVMDLLGHVPGVPGLFVSCIFSGTLSTISSGLNSLAAATLTDIIKPYIAPNLSETKATNLSKGLAVTFGMICLGLTYVASKLGNILQAALSLFGIVGAPMLGLFTLGMIFPWANYIGAFVGTLVSFTFMLWIGVGAYVTKPVLWKAPIRVDGCNWNLTHASTINRTLINGTAPFQLNLTDILGDSEISSPEGVEKLYTLSYLWYSATALAIVVLVGLVVSFITGRQDPKTIDARLICPLFDTIFPFLPEKVLKPLRFGVDHSQKHKMSDEKQYDKVPHNEEDLLKPELELHILGDKEVVEHKD